MENRQAFIASILVLIAVFQIKAPLDIAGKANLAAVENPQNETVPNIEVEAKAALAEDFSSGKILYEKNADYPLPLASLTKIVSSLTALDFISPEESIKTAKGEHFQTRDILSMIMVESSNGAVETLLNHVAAKNHINPAEAKSWFLALMTKKAAALGSGGMIFSTIDGVDVSENSAGAMGSAREMLRLAKASLDAPLWQFGSIRMVVSAEGLIYNLKPTNALDGEISGLFGAKTGLTDLAGGNLLIIAEYPVGKPIGIVVLGSSQEGRFQDTKKILEFIKNDRI